MKILITGAAGFIGSHLSKLLSKKGYKILGIDCVSDYYDKKLKLDRVKWIKNKNFKFYQLNLLNKKNLESFFSENKIDLIIHLAAQPGVMYSMENPFAYIENNIMAYLNILELSKKFNIKNIIYASSSSVYGKGNKVPFKENLKTNKPLTIYSATKITDEYISYVYSNLYSMNFVGLRFFTVYGPWGRPDMSPFIFVKNILKNKKISLFDRGEGVRDFTYIDDVVISIFKIVQKFKKNKKLPKNEVFNIGAGKPVKITSFLNLIESFLNKKAKINLKKNRKADMKITYSDSSKFKKYYEYQPKIELKEGIKKFIIWFKKYNSVK